MRRRTFLQTAALSAAARLELLADTPMPTATLGKTGLKISRFVVGGYHMNVQGEENATRIIHRAIDLGVNFFDSANLYHKGKSDEVYGRALEGGRRQKVMLMSKCEVYSRDGAMKVLEEQLRRMKTDYLDLWACHQVSEHKEVDQILAPNGSLEAFVKAKQQGKVRHIGFTGHRDPSIHLRLLEGADVWETVQMPINLIDPHYLSFITNVLPVARKKGLGVLAMKSNAMGSITKQQVAKIEDCLTFTWSQDVDAVVSGVETPEQLEANILTLKTMKKLSQQEISVLLHKTKQGKTGSQVEQYKLKESGAGMPCHRDGDPA
ncbi:aldo/keto reductase [uncultured Paludibaculum sp.]|uniref:aldo/keto reductase n=1 Tax=uncultured Paludibaculum sp. TaxID=1765020 RepID=UPI002AAB700C|nr:aldo/keto reductase [uncultured Paludibaculum sp.]